MNDEELIARLRDLGLNSPTIAADRIEELKQELKSHIEHTDDLIRSAEPMMALALGAAESAAEVAEAKVRSYELNDGMNGAVVDAIRRLLNAHNVPQAAFIDDHVANAIIQRNMAEAKLAKAVNVIKHLINIAPEGDDDEWHIALDAADALLAELEKPE